MARKWRHPDGNPNVLYANRDDTNRKLNLSYSDNTWNRNYWFFGVRPRSSLHFFSGFAGEVCFMSWLRQPPSIFPAS